MMNRKIKPLRKSVVSVNERKLSLISSDQIDCQTQLYLISQISLPLPDADEELFFNPMMAFGFQKQKKEYEIPKGDYEKKEKKVELISSEREKKKNYIKLCYAQKMEDAQQKIKEKKYNMDYFPPSLSIKETLEGKRLNIIREEGEEEKRKREIKNKKNKKKNALQSLKKKNKDLLKWKEEQSKKDIEAKKRIIIKKINNLWLKKKTSVNVVKKKKEKHSPKWYSQPWVSPKALLEVFNILVKLEDDNFGHHMINTPKLFFFMFNLQEVMSISDFISFLEYYNFFYNIFWTFRSFNFFFSLRKLHLTLSIHFGKNYKKIQQDPFENFINSTMKLDRASMRLVAIEQILKLVNIKKNDYYSAQLDTLVSFLFSLYMGKKNIFLGRADVNNRINSFKELVTRKNTIDEKFLLFVEDETKRLFDDFKWKTHAKHVVPQTTYYYNHAPIIGLHDWLIKDRPTVLFDFMSLWIDDELEGVVKDFYDNFMEEPCTHELKLVPEGGKVRAITTNHPISFAMKELQWNVHRHLKHKSEFDYIGKQVNTHVNMIEFEKDDLLMSGDYTNSTDYIPKEFTKKIYDVIFKKIDRPVLKSIVDHTLLTGTIETPTDSFKIESGQMMGGLLSFPALCIMNHCISSYVGIRQGKKKINGDDLLAAVKEEEKARWVKESPALGMLPNGEKSHLHHIYGTFNSQLIKKRRNGQLVRLEHFQVSKLHKSSLKDFCGENMGAETRFVGFARTWFENHHELDLLTGDSYKKDGILGDYLKKKEPFFWKYNRILSTIKSSCFANIGGFSKFYNKDDFDENVANHWTTCFENVESFDKYNGAVLSFWGEYNEGVEMNEFQLWLNAMLRKQVLV